MLTANRTSSMGHLYRFVAGSDLTVDDSTENITRKAVNKAALIREAALKSTIFVGVPRVSIVSSLINLNPLRLPLLACPDCVY